MFTPENELEQAMLQAASEPSSAREFYRRLLESELIVLGSRGERLAIDVVRNGSGFFHPIFTSPNRLAVFAVDELPNFMIPGRALFEATRGAQFIINPRSPLAKVLLPDEISWSLQNFRAIEFTILKPDAYPVTLIKALCVLFTNRAQLHTARLTYVGKPGNENDAHIVIGIEADGDIPRLAEEIFAAAAVTNPDHPIDVASLDTRRPSHPLHQHLLTVAPFYERERQLA